MDHEALHAQLFALYDGELAGPARRAVEDHLLDCVDCRALLARWKRVAGAALPSVELSASEVLVERVMRRIAAPAPRSLRLSRWLLEHGWLAPAVGLAALVMVMANGPLEQSVSVEGLLLSERANPAMQRTLSGEGASAEQVLALLTEESS